MTTLDAKAVLTLQPDFSSPPRVAGRRQTDLIDISAARRYGQIRGADVIHTMHLEFVMHGEEEILELSDFFHARKGKWEGFFIPSWHRELALAADAAQSATQLLIEPVGYEDNYFGEAGHRLELGHYVFLYHEDGTLHLSRVLAVETPSPDSPGDPLPETLTLETALPRSFQQDRCIVGFCYYVRFMNDELEIEYRGGNQATATVSVMEVVGETSEFDTTLCGVEFSAEFEGEGGGDTFDCYPDGEFEILPLAGSGYDGPWVHGNNANGYVRGDDLDLYADGFPDEPLADAEDDFDGPWIIGDHDGANEIELVASSASPGDVAAAEITIPIPFTGAEIPGHLYVLCLMRRGAISSGLDGWTLVADQATPADAAAQWTSVYTRTYAGMPPANLTIVQASGSRMNASILLLRSRSGGAISVQDTATGLYDSTASPGQHPVQSLAASGNGRYGIAASSCVFSGVSGTTLYHLLKPPWYQTTPPGVVSNNRFCVGGRPLQDSEDIDSGGDAEHNINNHDGAEVSVIFQT